MDRSIATASAYPATLLPVSILAGPSLPVCLCVGQSLSPRSASNADRAGFSFPLSLHYMVPRYLFPSLHSLPSHPCRFLFLHACHPPVASFGGDEPGISRPLSSVPRQIGDHKRPSSPACRSCLLASKTQARPSWAECPLSPPPGNFFGSSGFCILFPQSQPARTLEPPCYFHFFALRFPSLLGGGPRPRPPCPSLSVSPRSWPFLQPACEFTPMPLIRPLSLICCRHSHSQYSPSLSLSLTLPLCPFSTSLPHYLRPSLFLSSCHPALTPSSCLCYLYSATPLYAEGVPSLPKGCVTCSLQCVTSILASPPPPLDPSSTRIAWQQQQVALVPRIKCCTYYHLK